MYIGPKHGQPLYTSRTRAEAASLALCIEKEGHSERTPEHVFLALLANQSVEWGCRLLDMPLHRRTVSVDTFLALGLVETWESLDVAGGWDTRRWLGITPRGLAMLHTLDAAALNGDDEPDAHPYRWLIQVDVPPAWVANGLDLTEDRVATMFACYFGHIPTGDIETTVLASPDPLQIGTECGANHEGYRRYYCEYSGDCGHCEDCKEPQECPACGDVLEKVAKCDLGGDQIGIQFDCVHCEYSGDGEGCGAESGDVPSRRHCSCSSCVAWCEENVAPGTPLVVPQEWIIDRD
jgi:hypothetical protein